MFNLGSNFDGFFGSREGSDIKKKNNSNHPKGTSLGDSVSYESVQALYPSSGLNCMQV